MELFALLLFVLVISGALKLRKRHQLAGRYSLLGVALLAVPIATDIVGKAIDPSSSVGLKLLLYWPFDYAYTGFALLGFTLLGWLGARQRQYNAAIGAAGGAILGGAWCILAFFAVFQVHALGGGRL